MPGGARAAPASPPQAGGLRVGVVRQAQHVADGPVLDGVHPGGRHDGPGHRLDDPGQPAALAAALGDDPHGAGRDGILLVAGPREAERLRDDLARHDEAVARLDRVPVAARASRSIAGEVGAPGHLPDAEHGHDARPLPTAGTAHPGIGHAGHAAAMRSACSAIRAVVSTSDMSNGPSKASTVAAAQRRRGVGGVDEPPVEEVLVEAGDGLGRCLHADGGQAASACPRTGRPEMSGTPRRRERRCRARHPARPARRG